MKDLGHQSLLPPLTDEQRADHNPEFVLLDPRPISPERWREIAKWHDTFHPVAQEDLPLEEEWQRVNDLINALEYTRSRLSEAEAAVEAGEPEGDGGIWALQRLANYTREAGHYAALENIRAAAHNLGWCIDDGGTDRIAPTTGVCPLCDYDSEPRPAPFEKPVSACQRDCQTCGKKAEAVPSYEKFVHLACADEPVSVCTPDTWNRLTDQGKRNMMQVAEFRPHDIKKVLPAGGAGAGLQGEPKREGRVGLDGQTYFPEDGGYV